jgi:predicted protein tyrosine phosphatase
LIRAGRAPELNLDWVTPTLAIGGGFPSSAVSHLAEQLKVRAVVDVRSEDRDDEALLVRHGIAFLHLPTDDFCAVSPPMIEDGVAFALGHIQRGERVLVHCKEGIGRSVTLSLCILCALGAEPLDAMRLIKDRRVHASPNPPQFEAWSAWLRGRGIEPPHFDDFAAIAYRHLGSG